MRTRNLSSIRASLISYEIVWATPRKAPMNAYFLFDTHPLISNGYKLIANISNNKITPYSIIIDLFLNG